MSDNYLPWQNPTVTDAKLDTESLTVGANTVQRERIQVTGTTAAAIAAVLNSAPTTEYGLVVRNIPSGNHTVTQATASSLNAQVVGDVANGATDSGNPVKVGGVVQASVPTALSDGQRSAAVFNKMGHQLVRLNGERGLFARASTTLSGSSEVTVLGAGASGVFHDAVMVLVSNSLSSSATVTFRDATAGSTAFKIYAPGNQPSGFTAPHPIPQTSAAANWTAQADHGAGGLEVFFMGVKAK